MGAVGAGYRRRMRAPDPAIESVRAAAYTIPTDAPEADGTLSWEATTMICAHVTAGGSTGLGWTYAPAACARMIADVLAAEVTGQNALDTVACEQAMHRAVRNAGQQGVSACAISAVDTALWDLKARLLDVALTDLLGRARSEVPVYGSGGFTTYDAETLRDQVEGWLDAGVGAVKIKIAEHAGGDVRRDLDRVGQVRELVGPRRQVFVDANGGYDRKQAMRVGRALEEFAVTWFEEPVSSDDKQGLSQLSDRLDLDVTAGEYAFDVYEIRHLCEVVDCVQVDASRCGGISGWLRAAAIASSFGLDISGHCAPHLHAAAAAAVPNMRHLEWFHDHVRIESRFLDGAQTLRHGALPIDTARPGNGYALKAGDLERFRVA